MQWPHDALACRPMPEGWFLIVAALLALSGGAKIIDPDPTRGALRAAHLPSGRWASQALGVVELTVAGWAIALGGPFAAAVVTALYVGFAVFVWWALRKDIPLQSCGCFGRADTPPTTIHLVVNLAAAAGAAVTAFRPYEGILRVLSDQPALGIPYVGFICLGVYLLVLVLTELPLVLPNRSTA